MMTMEEFDKYWAPVAHKFYPNAPLNGDLRAVRMLSKALGLWSEYKEWLEIKKDDPSMTDELKQLLLKLAGPHGRTILKAYQVQRGIGHG